MAEPGRTIIRTVRQAAVSDRLEYNHTSVHQKVAATVSNQCLYVSKVVVRMLARRIRSYGEGVAGTRCGSGQVVRVAVCGILVVALWYVQAAARAKNRQAL